VVKTTTDKRTREQVFLLARTLKDAVGEVVGDIPSADRTFPPAMRNAQGVTVTKKKVEPAWSNDDVTR
jgi:hypothetical protein